MENKIQGFQLGMWLFAAMTGPILFYADSSWLSTLGVGCTFALLCYLAVRYGRHWNGNIYIALQILWIGVVLSQMLSYSASCWPTGNKTFPVVPLILLILAAASALKGRKATVSGICVLFWIVLFLVGIVVVAGFWNMDGQYLKPGKRLPSWHLMSALLLPAVTGFLPVKKGTAAPYFIVGVFAFTISGWIAGNLSPDLAQSFPWPFYEGAKTVQLMDIAKRLEPLVSVGVTIGNYALYCLLMNASLSLGEKNGKGKGAVYFNCALSAACLGLKVVIVPEVMVIISLFLWIFLPLLGGFAQKEKDLENCKKYFVKNEKSS